MISDDFPKDEDNIGDEDAPNVFIGETLGADNTKKESESSVDKASFKLTQTSFDKLKSDSNNCYGVILGLSTTGKSSCLKIISGCFSESNYTDNQGTDIGDINPIILTNSHREKIYLVDTAGEDFRSWLYHCARVNLTDLNTYFTKDTVNITPMARPQQPTDLFHELIVEAVAVYIIIPAYTDGITDERVRECGIILREVLAGKKVTFLINHVDTMQGVSWPTHYCSADEVDYLLHNHNNPDIVSGNIPIPELNEKVIEHLEDKYVSLVHGSNQLADMNDRHTYTDPAGQTSYKLNTLLEMKFNDNFPDDTYNYLYLLYPVRTLLRRRYEEIEAHISKLKIEGQAIGISPTNRMLNVGLNRVQIGSKYRHANNNFQQIIRDAFHMEAMYCATWQKELDEFNNAKDAVESKIKSLQIQENKLSDTNGSVGSISHTNKSIEHLEEDIENKKADVEKTKSDRNYAPIDIHKLNFKFTSAQGWWSAFLLLPAIVMAVIFLCFPTREEYNLIKEDGLYYKVMHYTNNKIPDPYFRMEQQEKIDLLKYFVKDYEKGRSVLWDADLFENAENQQRLMTKQGECGQAFTRETAHLNVYIEQSKRIYSDENSYYPDADSVFENYSNTKLESGQEPEQCKKWVNTLWKARMDFKRVPNNQQEDIINKIKNIDTIYDALRKVDPKLLGYANLQNDYERDMPLINSILNNNAQYEGKGYWIPVISNDRSNDSDPCKHILADGTMFSFDDCPVAERLNILVDGSGAFFKSSKEIFGLTSLAEKQLFCDKNKGYCNTEKESTPWADRSWIVKFIQVGGSLLGLVFYFWLRHYCTRSVIREQNKLKKEINNIESSIATHREILTERQNSLVETQNKIVTLVVELRKLNENTIKPLEAKITKHCRKNPNPIDDSTQNQEAMDV